MIAIVMVVTLMPVLPGANVVYAAAYSYSDGKLTITGSGSLSANDVTSGLAQYSETKDVVIVGYSTIGDKAFSGCSSLKSITITEGATSIGERAFWECSSLMSITIPAGVTSIGNTAFYNCSSLRNVTFPDSVTSLGYGLFYGCIGLEDTNIPKGVKAIDYSTFQDCSSLETITIPNGVTSIGNSAFNGCSSLKSITIPSSVETIGNYAFYGCTGFKSFDIPSGINKIDYRTFSGCSNLESITIPSNIETIGDSAFHGCGNLKSIIFESSTLPTLGSNVFVNVSATGEFVVPAGTTDTEKNKLVEKGVTIGSDAWVIRVVDNREYYGNDITVSWKEGYIPTNADTVATIKSNLVFSDSGENGKLDYLFDIQVKNGEEYNSLSDEDILEEGTTCYLMMFVLLKDKTQYRLKPTTETENSDFIRNYSGNITVLSQNFNNCIIFDGDNGRWKYTTHNDDNCLRIIGNIDSEDDIVIPAFTISDNKAMKELAEAKEAAKAAIDEELGEDPLEEAINEAEAAKKAIDEAESIADVETAKNEGLEAVKEGNIEPSKLEGTCQMVDPEGRGVLIGLDPTTVKKGYSAEILVLDCTLLAENKPAWIYTSGRCGFDENGLWTVVDLQYGYYWTLFRIYDKDGKLVDEQCYGFVNI